MKDVTREYTETVDVKMKTPRRYKSKYAYLSVFNCRDWSPVCWGKKSYGMVTFKDVGKDVIYLPVVMTEEGVIPFADPVMVDRDGKISTIKADTVNKQTMTENSRKQWKRSIPMLSSTRLLTFIYRTSY